MKKLILIMALAVSLAQCSTLVKKESASGDKKGDKNSEAVFYRDSLGKEARADASSPNGWSAFSSGLYYKNLGGEKSGTPEGIKYLTMAVDFLQEALKYNISLDNVYLHLSECYFYLKNYEKSLEFARKTVQIDRNNQPAYNRMFAIYNVLENHQKAAETYEEYLKYQPDSIYIQYIVAEYYYKKLNDTKKAEEAFNKVIAISRKTSVEDFYMENAYYSLGYLAFRSREFDRSIEHFRKVRDINVNNINAAYMLALLYMEKYDLNGGEEYARIYLNKLPDNMVMNSIMGRILYLKGGRDAVRYLRIVKDSKTIEGLLANGLYQETLMKDDEAEKYLKAVVKYKPDFLSPHLALARIEMRRNNEKAAFNEWSTAGVLAYKNRLYEISRLCFTEAVKTNGAVPEIYYYLGRSYEELDNISLAIINYKKVQELKPGVEIVLHLGYLYGKKDDTAASFRYFDTAISMDPANSKPYFLKGLNYIKASDYDSAELNLRKAITLSEKNENYHFYLAIVQEKRNRFDDAVKSLEKAIEYNPQSARAYNYLGYLYAEKNIHIDKSYSLIQKALELEPRNGAYLDSLGWVYFRKGDFKLALKKLLEAERELDILKSPDPVVYEHIGDVFEKTGDVRNAVLYWKKSLEMKKDDKIHEKIKKFEKIK